MAAEDGYRRAQEDAAYRQAFLDSIDLEDAKPYVSRVVYVPKQPFFGKKTLMQVDIETGVGIRDRKSVIEVLPLAFAGKFHPYVEDFLGCLIDHEGYHAKEVYETPNLISNTFPLWKLNEMLRFAYEIEFRAFSNQIHSINAKKRGFSESYIKWVFGTYMFYKNLTEGININPKLQARSP